MVYRNVRRGSRSGRSGTAARRRFGGELRAVQHQTAVGFGQQGLSLQGRFGGDARRRRRFQRSRLQGPVALQQQRRQNICRNDARRSGYQRGGGVETRRGRSVADRGDRRSGHQVLASRSGGQHVDQRGRAERCDGPRRRRQRLCRRRLRLQLRAGHEPADMGRRSL